MTVVAPGAKVEAELDENVSIDVAMGDASVAKVGDRITVKGGMPQGMGMMRPGMIGNAQANEIQIELQNPLTGPRKKPVRKPPAKEPAANTLTDTSKFFVVDIRDAAAYAAGHIPNSVNIGLRGRLETWTGIMVPWGSKLVLSGKPTELREAVQRLHRVGYSATVVDIADWKKAGLPLKVSKRTKPRDLHSAIKAGKGPVVVDVRLPEEWMALRIGVSLVNLPINRLGELSAKLDPAQPVVAVCNSAYRSSMAVGLLERKGFKDIGSLDGGGEAWIEAGLPVFEAA